MLDFPAWKIWLVAGICALGALFAAPNLLPRDVADSLPGWMPNQQIALGLDLSGGAHLLLEIDEEVYTADRLMTMESDIRRILRTERIGVRVLGTQDMTVNFALRDAADAEAVREELSGIGDGFLIVVNDDGTMTVTMTEEGLTLGLSDAIERTIEVLGKRIDPNGVLEPIITRQGRDRILVQVPGLDNTEELKGRLGQTAKLTFHLVDDEASVSAAQEGNLPLGSVLMPGSEESDATFFVLRSEVLVSGENLADAASTFDQSGNPAVSFSFDSIGASRFCEVTTASVGRRLAIVLDGEVISAPRINSPICGGNGIITGSFSTVGAENLAILLRAGALPCRSILLKSALSARRWAQIRSKRARLLRRLVLQPSSSS